MRVILFMSSPIWNTVPAVPALCDGELSCVLIDRALAIGVLVGLRLSALSFLSSFSYLPKYWQWQPSKIFNYFWPSKPRKAPDNWMTSFDLFFPLFLGHDFLLFIFHSMISLSSKLIHRHNPSSPMFHYLFHLKSQCILGSSRQRAYTFSGTNISWLSFLFVFSFYI